MSNSSTLWWLAASLMALICHYRGLELPRIHWRPTISRNKGRNILLSMSFYSNYDLFEFPLPGVANMKAFECIYLLLLACQEFDVFSDMQIKKIQVLW